jgi:hypothetical protein
VCVCTAQAIKLKPRFGDAYNNLASAHMQLGQVEEVSPNGRVTDTQRTCRYTHVCVGVPDVRAHWRAALLAAWSWCGGWGLS